MIKKKFNKINNEEVKLLSSEILSEGGAVLSNLFNYSTDEIRTGELWVDGKPIYRKVMQGTFTPAKDTDILIVRFDFDFAIISLKGVVTSSNNIDWSIPNYYGLATEYWCDVYQRGRELFINGGEKYENSPFHLIIEYIKK